MDPAQQDVARTCLAASESNSLTFPEIVSKLIAAGFESYLIDYRRAMAIYYLSDGDSLELSTDSSEVPVATAFDPASLQAAIREAQTLAPGYTYRGFCDKAKRAGCAGYIVSFLGRRALYFGRTGETHVEPFPQ